MLDRIDPRHRVSKRALQILGPGVLLAGLVLSGIGLADFFGSEWPTRFWTLFVGLPLVGWGFSICKFAFLAEVSRYAAGEVAPVARDTLGYLGMETAVACSSCGASNERGSKFCERCGSELTRTCASCGKDNEPGSAFCDACGKPL